MFQFVPDTMIKEKHEKGTDAGSNVVKEEPTNADNALNKSLGEFCL